MIVLTLCSGAYAPVPMAAFTGYTACVDVVLVHGSTLLKLRGLKDQINTLTNDGERARGLWTDSPEFICKNIFNN